MAFEAKQTCRPFQTYIRHLSSGIITLLNYGFGAGLSPAREAECFLYVRPLPNHMSRQSGHRGFRIGPRTHPGYCEVAIHRVIHNVTRRLIFIQEFAVNHLHGLQTFTQDKIPSSDKCPTCTSTDIGILWNTASVITENSETGMMRIARLTGRRAGLDSLMLKNNCIFGLKIDLYSGSICGKSVSVGSKMDKLTRRFDYSFIFIEHPV